MNRTLFFEVVFLFKLLLGETESDDGSLTNVAKHLAACDMMNIVQLKNNSIQNKELFNPKNNLSAIALQAHVEYHLLDSS